MFHNIDFKKKRDMLKKKHERFNVADKYYHLSEKEILNINNSRKIPLNLALINTTGEYNVSTMIRTAAIFGFQKVYIFGRRRFDNRGLVGANHYIDIERIQALDEEGNFLIQPVIEKIETDNIAPIVFEIDGKNMTKVNWPENINNFINKNLNPTIFVGNEWEGFDERLLKFLKSYPYTMYVRIPQNGVLRSLNVGIAMAIATWDIVKSMNWIYDEN